MHNDNTQTPTSPSARSGRFTAAVVVSALAFLASACGGADDDDAAEAGTDVTSDGTADAAAASGDPTVEIASPAAGAQVGPSFDVELAVNFPIGEPGTGNDHVHLYYDGNTAQGEYGIAYEEGLTVTGLAPGEHTIEAVVAHADHSLTDARSMEVAVVVTGDDAGANDTGTLVTSGGDGY